MRFELAIDWLVDATIETYYDARSCSLTVVRRHVCITNYLMYKLNLHSKQWNLKTPLRASFGGCEGISD